MINRAGIDVFSFLFLFFSPHPYSCLNEESMLSMRANQKVLGPIFISQIKVFTCNYKYTYYSKYLSLFFHIVPTPIQVLVSLRGQHEKCTLNFKTWRQVIYMLLTTIVRPHLDIMKTDLMNDRL